MSRRVPDPHTAARMHATTAALAGAGLDARVHSTRGVLDITASLHQPGGRSTEVIVDEDGYVQMRVEPVIVPAERVAVRSEPLMQLGSNNKQKFPLCCHSSAVRSTTVNEDGSPHVTAVGALWLDGTFWFQTGAGTRKGRNVMRDPRCSIAVSIRGADVVIEGDAVRVTEPGALARIAKAWADQGWPAEPDESGPGIAAPFNAPSQGPPPWNVYRIEPRSAIVTLGVELGGLTRFRF
jgi:Pyridoxamine 5'-phosphate oxidase